MFFFPLATSVWQSALKEKNESVKVAQGHLRQKAVYGRFFDRFLRLGLISALGAKQSAPERAVRPMRLRQFGGKGWGSREERLRDCAQRQGRLRRAC